MILKSENECKALPEKADPKGTIKEKQHMLQRSRCVNVSVTTPIFTLYSAARLRIFEKHQRSKYFIVKDTFKAVLLGRFSEALQGVFGTEM